MIPRNFRPKDSTALRPAAPVVKPAPAPSPSPTLALILARIPRPSTAAGLNVVLIGLLLIFVFWAEERGPKPTPRPSNPGDIWVTLVKDSSNPDQDFAQLEADPDLATGLKQLGVHLRDVDQSVKWIDTQHLRPYVEKAGLPALIIQGEKTKEIVAKRCPKSPDELLAEVRKFKGAADE